MANKDLYEEIDGQVTLTLEDGTDLLCDIVATYPCNGKEYIALVPTDGGDDAEIFLYRFEGVDADGEDMKLIDIEDDDEFEAASDAFDEFLDTVEFNEVFNDEEE